MSRPDLIVAEPSHVGHARLVATAAAERAGLDADRIPKVALATTELATNLLKHAGQGVLTMHTEPGRLDVLSLDTGPGIHQVGQSMRDGYSTTGTMGGGLGAVRRAADVFDLFSLPGAGTAVLARWQDDRARSAKARIGAAMRTAPGEVRCGDLWAAWEDKDLVTVSVSDGLGHGERAEQASQTAMRSIAPQHTRGPADILESIQQAMSATRGATVAITQIAPERGRLWFCGVGNIAGRIYTGAAARPHRLVSRPGIVGAGNTVGTAQFAGAWTAESWLLLYSDGVSDRWDLNEWPGLLRHDPATVAAWILAQRGRGRDDSCVLVVTGGDGR
ncbi:MAG TPA: ATP-binding protein [Pseudonocardiaceae bacterium]|jgi:anti-sigma regulatory factor (Ser/Thr protein kinase)|nr:ATP-binding protein [Pseudonocardiaceae bacterium]